tara:strand:+ start:145 stop:1503 length:1359 start_codon:yes stop_codon:yes gene_type:complete
MSVKVIEINDSNIKVGDEAGLVFQSPGFSLVTDDKVEVGEFAESQCRIQPTNSFSKYWYELNLEPISHSPKVRHHADLAYAQLMDIAEEGDIDGDVIFSVPGSFTQQQLAILLGLVRQTKFSPVGLVNSALVESIHLAHKEYVVHTDIQLHQVVVTLLASDETFFRVENIIQIPGVGTQNFMNLMMQVATDSFISQCRFNPQHDANTEQDLYNEIQGWLSNYEEGKTVQLELKSRDTTYSSKITWDNLTGIIDRYYQKITKQIDFLKSSNKCHLLLNERLTRLPGFLQFISKNRGYEVISAHQGIQACIDNKNLICSEDRGTILVDKIAKTKLGVQSFKSSSAEQLSKEASHLLFGNEAIKLSRVAILNRPGERQCLESSQEINVAMKDLPEYLGIIDKTPTGIYFNSSNDYAILNHQSINRGVHSLQLGDQIKFSETGDEIRLIKVRNGEQ